MKQIESTKAPITQGSMPVLNMVLQAGLYFTLNFIKMNYKLSNYQKSILYVLANAKENNYILLVCDTRTQKTQYILTNGEDDFDIIKHQTIASLVKKNIFKLSRLPSSDEIIRQKLFLDPKIKDDIFRSCLPTDCIADGH